MGGTGSTTLDDQSLQILLDAAESAIVARRGLAGGPITDSRRGTERVFVLSRPASSITSVTEINGTTQTVLTASDWTLWPNQMVLERLIGGTNPSVWWADRVQVVYAPVDDTAERKRVQLALVKLDLAYNGLAALATGNESRQQQASYQAAREQVLDSFASTFGPRY